MRPLREDVFVQLDDKESKTEAGIIIPEKAQDNVVKQGTVIAVGSKGDWPFNVGDKVIIDPMAGRDFKMDGKKCLCLKEFNIWGVVQ